MRKWLEIIIVFLICVIGLLLISVNAYNYDNRQNKARNNQVGQLY